MGRPPRTRTAIAELVGDSNKHDWSIDELREALAGGGLETDFSTVFRAVDALVGAGELRRVALGTPEARYEPRASHHEHVRCNECGTVDAVSTCVVRAAVPRVERQTGFTLTGHDVLFHGICPACQVEGS